jgi:dipeptidyl aminopeptidase/acylaminoacyl peptidase
VSGGDGRGSVLRITSVIEPRANNFHAKPSPDGSQIAFDSDRDGERGVYVSSVDGRHVRRVSGEGFAAIPSWSPDGKTLAFVRAEPSDPDVWNLWTVELASGQTRRLTSYHQGQLWGGSWFPDGRRIAYTHDDRLLVIDRSGGVERVYPSPVKGTPMDFTHPQPIGARFYQLDWAPAGYDHNYVINRAGKGLALAARVYEPKTGRVMEVHTTQPGVQFYSANYLDGSLTGKGGFTYWANTGFCLETQHFPDSVNQHQFPSVILHPGQTYRQTTTHKFSTK